MNEIEIGKQCPDCGRTLTEQRWERTSDNKKFHAWRHEVKSDCKYIEWINEPKQNYKAKSAKYSPRNTQEQASQIVAMRELYLLVKAIAIMIGGWNAKPPEMVEKWINENIIMLKNKK